MIVYSSIKCYFRSQKILLAQAEADGIRLKGIAKAEAMEAVGRAEAERMRLRAEAYSKYGDAAILNLILDTLPQIAAEVAAPLSKTKEIVIMNGSNGEPATLQSLTNLGKDFTTLVGTVPHAIRALTNVDLSQVRLFSFYRYFLHSGLCSILSVILLLTLRCVFTERYC